jgi:hypothetical protein
LIQYFCVHVVPTLCGNCTSLSPRLLAVPVSSAGKGSKWDNPEGKRSQPPHLKVLGSAHLALPAVRASTTPLPSSEVPKAAKFQVKPGWKHFLSGALGNLWSQFAVGSGRELLER